MIPLAPKGLPIVVFIEAGDDPVAAPILIESFYFLLAILADSS
jgi:hypothetical protein